MKTAKYRLVILSGPSCVGKSPLAKSLARFYPELSEAMQPLVLYNSRPPRPGETDGKDYYFRPRNVIEKLKGNDDFVVIDVRGDLQALDLKELAKNINRNDVLFEGNPFIGRVLQTHEALEEINRLSVFMSPVSKEEINFLQSELQADNIKDLITDIMRRKLLRRTRRQKGELSMNDLLNIENRASSAYHELLDAHYFQYVIPNHDGEDSENWDAFYYPVGDARKSLLSFASLLKGEPAETEKWDENLLK